MREALQPSGKAETILGCSSGRKELKDTSKRIRGEWVQEGSRSFLWRCLWNEVILGCKNTPYTRTRVSAHRSWWLSRYSPSRFHGCFEASGSDASSQICYPEYSDYLNTGRSGVHEYVILVQINFETYNSSQMTPELMSNVSGKYH